MNGINHSFDLCIIIIIDFDHINCVANIALYFAKYSLILIYSYLKNTERVY